MNQGHHPPLTARERMIDEAVRRVGWLTPIPCWTCTQYAECGYGSVLCRQQAAKIAAEFSRIASAA